MSIRLSPSQWIIWISVATVVSAIPAVAATVHKCAPGQPTATSYTWDFKGEANTLFKDIQSDAQNTLYHADKLQSMDRNLEIGWQEQADQLESLKRNINDIGPRLCRLETIRRSVAPWQQHEIDRIAVSTRLMADNAQDAILFLNANKNDLWSGTYRQNLDNLYNEAHGLTRSVGNAVEYSAVSKEYRGLGSKLGTRTGS